MYLLLLNNGQGDFVSSTVLDVGGLDTFLLQMNFEVGDFNDDGIVDLVYSSEQRDTPIGQPGNIFSFTNFYQNDGAGNFSEFGSIQGVFTSGLKLVDANNDGLNDIVCVTDDDGARDLFATFLNNNGVFGQVPDFELEICRLSVADKFDCVDMNFDGFVDFVVQHSDGRVSLLTSNGDGTFNFDGLFSTVFMNEGYDLGLKIDDADFDGDLDLYCTGTDGVILVNGVCDSSVEVGDINLDGSVDLLDVAPFVDLLTSGRFSG